MMSRSLRPVRLRARRPAGRALAGVALCGVVLVTGLLVAGCDKGQHMDSSSNETALRATRLIGYPAAQVGVDRARASLSLVLPSVSSAADIELAWQTGMAILTEAYPASPLYRVVIRTPERALLSAEAVGSAVLESVAKDDPMSLKKATTFIVLANVTVPAKLLPEESVTTTGQANELDSANRAAGVETTGGPAVTQAEALTAAWKDAYAKTPGVPAPQGGAQEAARFAAGRVKTALKLHSVDGDRALEKVLAKFVVASDVEALRQWAATVEAVASKVPLASVLELTAGATQEVAESKPVGALPQGAITALERVPSLDVTAMRSVQETGFGEEALVKYGVSRGDRRGFAYRVKGSSGGETVAAPDVWLAYRWSDGAIYWLAGQGGAVALTDTSLRGWGYQIPSASLVEAADISRVVATFSAGSV